VHTGTTEYFYEGDGVTSLDNFFDQAEEMLGDNRFDPEAGIDQYLDEGGDVNIEYVKICDSKLNELWRDSDYAEDKSDLNNMKVGFGDENEDESDLDDMEVKLDDEDKVDAASNYQMDEDEELGKKLGFDFKDRFQRQSFLKEKCYFQVLPLKQFNWCDNDEEREKRKKALRNIEELQIEKTLRKNTIYR